MLRNLIIAERQIRIKVNPDGWADGLMEIGTDAHPIIPKEKTLHLVFFCFLFNGSRNERAGKKRSLTGRAIQIEPSQSIYFLFTILRRGGENTCRPFILGKKMIGS